MKKILLVILVLCLITVFGAGFSDIPANHWAKDAVENLRQLGLISGFPDNTFRGNEALTRYQIALILYNFYSFLESNLYSMELQITNINVALEKIQITEETSKEIIILQSKIQVLEEEVNKVLTELSEIKKTNQITSEHEIENISLAKIKDFEERLKSIYSLIENLQGEFSTLKNSLQNLQPLQKPIQSIQEMDNTDIAKKIEHLESFDQKVERDIKELYRFSKSFSEFIEKITPLLETYVTTAELEKRLEEFKNIIIKREEMITLRSFFDKLNEDLKTLKAKINDFSVLSNKISNLETELSNLKEKLIYKDSTISTSNLLDFEHIEKELEILSNKLAEFEKTFSQQQKTDKNWFENNINDIRQSISNLKKDLQHVSAELDNYRKILFPFFEYEKISNELMSFEKRIENFNSFLNVLNNKFEILKKNVESSYPVEILNQMSEIREEIRNLISENTKIFRIIDSLKEEIAVQSGNQEKISSKLGIVEKDLQKLKDEVKLLSEKKSELETSKIYVTDRELSNQIEMISNRIEEIEKSLNEVSRLREIGDPTKVTISTLEKEIEELKAFFSNIKEDTKSNESSDEIQLLLGLSKRVDRIEESLKELSQQRTDKVVYATELSKIYSEINTLKNEIAKIKESPTVYEKTVVQESKTSELEALQLKELISELKNSIESIKNKTLQLEEKVSVLEKDEITSEIYQQISEMKQKIERLEEIINEEKSKDEIAIKEIETKTEYLQIKDDTQIRQLETSLKEINEFLEVLSNRIDLLEEYSNSFYENLQKKVNIEIYEEDLYNLSNYISKINEMLRIFELRIASLEELQNVVYESTEDLKAKFNELSERTDKIEKEMSDNITDLFKKTDTFEEKLKIVFNSIGKISENEKEFRREIQTLTERMELLDRDFEIFKEEVLKRITEIGIAQKENQEYIESLEKRIGEKFNQIEQDLNSLITPVQEDNKELFSKVEELTTQIRLVNIDIQKTNEILEKKANISYVEQKTEKLKSEVDSDLTNVKSELAAFKTLTLLMVIANVILISMILLSK